MAGSRGEEDDRTLERVRRLCLGLPGAEEAVLQRRPLFRVGNRRFALFNGSASPPSARWDASGRSLHFLSDPHELPALREDPRFVPSPHHGHRGWLAMRLEGADLDWDEVAELVASALRQVVPRPERSG
ncbi:MAG: MmcQ/YjbR family DNA-binding protein [Acidimicrobiia bacterium]